VIHVVDAHPLIWHLENWRGLGQNAARILTSSRDRLIVPTIVLAEARYVIAKGGRSTTWSELLDFVRRDPRLSVHDLDLDIVNNLPYGLEMHDAIICATVISYQEASGEPVPLITKDRRIRESGLVETVW
jgi:predicted nucleic acid-binding protein